jgi:sugar-specific transcriptional regulator TrmB
MADKKLIVDLAAGTQTYVDLTPEEIQQRELDAIEAATRKAEEDAANQAKADAKASALAKLQALGLTSEEATAIL